MSQADPELERLCAQRADRSLGRLGYLIDRRPRLRMSLQFFQVGFRPLAPLGALLSSFRFLQFIAPLE